MQSLKLYRVKQHFSKDHISHVQSVVRDELARYTQQTNKIKAGMRIAIAVGSRGIANIDLIIKALVNDLKARSAEPFIVPAMGSHGGANAAGQAEVLASYGITAESMGVPVLSSMEVVSLPQGDLPCPVFQDKNAHEADGIILVNRIKVHTDFHGVYESGLIKMSVIGLGKHAQAKTIHQYGSNGLRHLMPRVARQILQNSKIIMGLAIVENAYEQTMLIKAIDAVDIEHEEPRLLEICRQNMPHLPVDNLDVLIVDQIGKNISGTGMDTNIIGRIRIRGEEEPAGPDINRLIACDLTAGAHGNAAGMGLADFITRRLQEKIDFAATYENTITSAFTERGKMPIVAETDAQAYEYATRTWGDIKPEDAAIIRIQDTLHLDILYVSEAVWRKIKDRPNISLLDEPISMFDITGQLTTFQRPS